MNKQFSIGIFSNIMSDDAHVLEKDFPLIQRCNPEHVEITYESPLFVENPEALDWYRKEIGVRKTIVHAPFLNISLVSIHEPIRRASLEVLQQAMVYSSRLGAEVFTFHAGTYPNYMPRKQPLEYLMRSIPILLSTAKNNNLQLAIENVNMKNGLRCPFLTTKEEMTILLTKFPSLSMTFDIGHAILNGDDEISWLKKFHKRIADIHFHDVTTHDHQELGTGKVNIERFLIALKKYNYQGFLSIELGAKAHKETERSIKLLRKLQQKINTY